MGLYMYINQQDREIMRKVKDKQVNKLFQEALSYDSSLMISEHIHTTKKSIFHKKKETTLYTIYHEAFCFDRNPMFQAREQFSGSGKKEVVLAYLYGIINGYHTEMNIPPQEKTISDLWRVAQKKNCDDFINLFNVINGFR